MLGRAEPSERKIQGPFKPTNVKDMDRKTHKAIIGLVGTKDPTTAADVLLGQHKRRRRRKDGGEGSETDSASGSEYSDESSEDEADAEARKAQVGPAWCVADSLVVVVTGLMRRGGTRRCGSCVALGGPVVGCRGVPLPSWWCESLWIRPVLSWTPGMCRVSCRFNASVTRLAPCKRCG